MTTRKYTSRSQQTTLSSSVTSGGSTIIVVSATTVLGGSTITAGQTFTIVIDPDTALEEIVDITAVSTNTFSVNRGIDGSSAQDHSAGAVVRHMAIGRDYRESNSHIEATSAYNDGISAHSLHGLASGDGDLVGTAKAQTLTNKTIDAASNTITGITSAMITNGTIVNEDINASAAIAYSKLSLAGSITSADITNNTIVDGDINASAAITATKISGTAVTQADTGTVTSTMIANGTIVDADINASAAIARTKIANPTADVSNGGYKITSLGTPTTDTDASTKAYVDTSISNLIGGAPSTLDTLKEISDAIAGNASFSDTVVLKTGSTMSGNLAMGTNKVTGLGTPTTSTDAATKGYVDTVTVAPSNLTGPITSVGSATSVAAQTGTGSTFVMNTSPTLVTPVLGVATATSINGTSIPSTKTLVVTTDKLSALAATTSAELAGVISDETGSGALVFATSPTLVTPNLGTPSAINLTNATNTPTDATKANLASPTFTGTVTIPAGAVITSPKIGSTYTAKTAAYTFASGDEGNIFSMNNAATQQFNIPTDATFNFAVGTEINIFWITGAGQPTIGAVTPGTTTVISTGATSATPKLRVANSGATCKKLAANSWIVFGDLA